MMKNKKLTPFAVFCAVIVLFYLLFTRLIVKTDDGHFLGILNESGFDLAQWLKLRYETISGRTVCELLTMKFLGTNLIAWKLCAALLWIYIVHFVLRFTSTFVREKRGAGTFVLCIPFLVFIGCLNPAAFWFSGSFTYLFPFACMLITLTPVAYELAEINYRRIPSLILSVVAAPIACSQEQSAALTLGFYAVTLVFLFLKRKVKIYSFVSLPFCVAQTYILFSAPGMSERMKAEASGFDGFNSMNTAHRILCGLSNYYAFGFMMSVFVFGFFITAVTLKLRSLENSRLSGVLSRILPIFSVLSFVGGNILSLAAERTIPDKAFERMFILGQISPVGAVIIALCSVTLVLIIASFVTIAREDFKTGFTASVCYIAGVCSAVILGFSSSVYASGQRVFFFSEMLTLISCAVLLGSLKENKAKQGVEFSAVVISLCMLFVNCMSWFFLEIPIMG